MDLLRIDYPELINSRHMKWAYSLLARLRLLAVARMLLAANLYNPIKAAISVVAIKGEAS